MKSENVKKAVVWVIVAAMALTSFAYVFAAIA